MPLFLTFFAAHRGCGKIVRLRYVIHGVHITTDDKRERSHHNGKNQPAKSESRSYA